MHIQVENAGLCLLAPFLSDYFKDLGLTDNEKFKSESRRNRSAILLDYLATGDPNPPGSKPAISLSIFLSGKNSLRRIGPIPRLTPFEILESKKLLVSIIKQWDVLGKSSIESFRQSFLTRNGNLYSENGIENLVIDRRTIDILLERLPWSFKTIHLPWMQRTIFVEW